MNTVELLLQPGSGIAAVVGVCLVILINHVSSGKDHA